MMTQVVGIDPGLVHTGVVSLEFDTKARLLSVSHHVVDGLDAEQVRQWLQFNNHCDERRIFIEKYVPRQSLASDERMVKGEQELRNALPGCTFVRNTGSKQVVPPQTMEVLKVWSFPTSTHHQDLRAAARIALFGMMKNKDLNRLLADLFQSYIGGQPWIIQTQ
jgi:hypothetical protein